MDLIKALDLIVTKIRLFMHTTVDNILLDINTLSPTTDPLPENSEVNNSWFRASSSWAGIKPYYKEFHDKSFQKHNLIENLAGKSSFSACQIPYLENHTS